MTAERMLTREEAAAVLRGPRGEELRAMAVSYTVPLCWAKPNDEGGVEIQNGTVFFLDAGQEPFAVTARHVYQGYRAAKSECPETVCQLANLPWALDERLISQHERSGDGPDIATFRIEPGEVTRFKKRTLTHRPGTWPPLPPEEGKGVFFAGYPGRGRIRVAHNEIRFGAFHGLLVATTVNDRNICCQIDERHLAGTPWGGRAPANYDIRGISGAPLLTLVEHNGVWSWHLGGVIYTAHLDWSILFAARADFILPDGHVKPYDWVQRRAPQT